MTPEAVAVQFDDRAQQERAGRLGIWIFLATEVMFFGGLFTGYALYRVAYGPAFEEAGDRLDLALGTVNTAALLASSLTMALAVRSAGQGRRGPLLLFLGLTIALGAAFLGIKGVEYAHKAEAGLLPGRGFRGPSDPGGELFFSFYFVMTGTHAVHLVAGLALLAALAAVSVRRPVGRMTVEVAGLYWHFVDVVWIFLFPLLYLLGRHRP